MTADPHLADPKPRLAYCQSELQKYLGKPRKIDPNHEFRAPLAHGWLVPYLVWADELFIGRWRHWTNVMTAGEIGPEQIPEIHWCGGGHPTARKMWERTFNAVTNSGDWQGWSGWTNCNYVFDWLLFGLGHHGTRELPKEPERGACSRLYQTFCLEAAMAWPHDYFGDMLAENRHGQSRGFYPTPMCVVEMMCQMLFKTDEDERDKTVMDPCLGTGRMLLCASSHSYRLYGMDIDATVIKASLINGYFYAPWLVKPFPFLDRDLTDPSCSAQLSDHMQAACPRPDVAAYLANTIHDADLQAQVEPLKVRRTLRPDEQRELALF